MTVGALAKVEPRILMKLHIVLVLTALAAAQPVAAQDDVEVVLRNRLEQLAHIVT